MPRRGRVALALLLLAGAGCSKRAPKQIATFDGHANAAALDATSVYLAVTDLGATKIVRIPRAGGAPETVAEPAELVMAMALAGDALILGEIVIEDTGKPLAVDPHAVSDPEALAAAAAVGTKQAGALVRLGLRDHALTTLATFEGSPGELVVDGTAAFVTSIGVFRAGQLETDHAGRILSVPDLAHPAPPVILARDLTLPKDLAVDASSVYVTDHFGHWRVARSGGSLTSVTTRPAARLDHDATTFVLRDASGTITIDSSGAAARVLAE